MSLLLTPTPTPTGAGTVAGTTIVSIVSVLVSYSLLSLAVSVVAAMLYRWYFQTTIPAGLAALLGVAAVAISLQTMGLLGEIIGNSADAGVVTAVGDDPFDPETVLINVAGLLVAFAVTPLGARIGDAIARDTSAVSGAKELDAEVGRLVRSVGRMTVVRLPDAGDIEDMENYDPVEHEVKERMGGKSLVFPNRLTVTDLRDRLVTRLKADYEVGYVDVELAEDATIDYLALGSRVAGIGPTLGPGTCAVAIEADPAHTASPGDIVQVWTGGDDPKRITTAELRATAGDVVTLAADEADVESLDGAVKYRLITLPVTPRSDREFTSLLRAADETLGVAHLAAESALVGQPVTAIDATVVAIRSEDGSLETLPRRTRELATGDDIYAVGRPEALRRLEQQASEADSTPVEQ